MLILANRQFLSIFNKWKSYDFKWKFVLFKWKSYDFKWKFVLFKWNSYDFKWKHFQKYFRFKL